MMWGGGKYGHGVVQMRRLVLAVLMTVASYSASSASPTTDYGFQGDWKDRRLAATEYASLFREFESAIPTLTPSEQQWVSTEYKALSSGESKGSREDTFLNSREKQLADLHERIQSIRTVVRYIQQAQKTDNAKQENLYWVSFLYLLSQEVDCALDLETLLAKHAIQKSDFPPRLGVNWLVGSADGQVQMTWHWWARAIWDGFLFKLSSQMALK
jgi:hypothetical protein